MFKPKIKMSKHILRAKHPQPPPPPVPSPAPHMHLHFLLIKKVDKL